MRILNVVVAYKNLEEIKDYAQELSRQSCASDIGLVITVNESHNENVELFMHEISNIALNIDIFETDKNLGYFNGFLYGVNCYIDKHGGLPEWVVLSNTDIEYRNKNFYEVFLKDKYSEDTWCVGPSIYKSETKTYQNPEAKERRSKAKLVQLYTIFSHKYLARLYMLLSRIKRSRPDRERPQSGFVYEIHGAFFAMRREFIDTIKSKKYGVFLYSEETYVAEELLKVKKRTFYDSDIEVIHNEHSVTGKLSVDRKAKYLAESLKYLIDTYY